VQSESRTSGERLTLGVAVAIPQPHAAVLTKWRREAGDPAADLIWPHVTLLPPTEVPVESLPEVEQHLSAAAATVAPFDMHLSGTGTFRPSSPVVFVQVARGVAPCEALERAIRRGPLARELDFPYHPHVTVAQQVDDAALDATYDGLSGFVARFHVTHFVLFHRDAAQRWQWRTEFPLASASA